MKRLGAVLGLVLAVSTAACGVGGMDGPWDRMPKVTITPESPAPSDEVSVSVRRWVEAGHQVAGSTLRTHGNTIRLDLDWEMAPGVDVIAIWPPPYCWETHTVSIGTWNPGMYTVIVNNDGRDSVTASFTVVDDTAEPPPTSWNFFDLLLSGQGDFNLETIRPFVSIADRFCDLWSMFRPQ